MKVARFEVYKAKDGWRWRFIAGNGLVIADGGQAYTTKAGAIRARSRMELLVLLQSEHGYV